MPKRSRRERDKQGGKVGNKHAHTHLSLKNEGQDKSPTYSNKGQEIGRKKARHRKDKARSSDGTYLEKSQWPKQTSTDILSGFERTNNGNHTYV